MGKCTDEYIYSCYNNYIASTLPLCVKVIGTGKKSNACRNRPSYTLSTRYLKGFTIGSTCMIELFLKKTMGTFLMSIL